MNSATNWKKIMEGTEDGTGALQASTTAQQVDVNKALPDPSGITQSYYKAPATSEDFDAQTRPVYEQSQAVKDAGNMLTQAQANKPGEYKSQYGDQIQGMIDNILNREKFSYDYAADPMYQQYAQQYQRGGQMAMKNAMAESAALTGGYGNSYAQQVGQQTYQQYMENLAGKIPELRDAAYNMYQAEGNAMRDNLGMLQGQDELDYGRYRDLVGDWRNDIDMLYNMYNLMSQEEYNRYLNDAAAWEQDRAYWYQQAYDALQQANWEKQFNAQYGDQTGGGGRRYSGDDENLLIEAVAGALNGGWGMDVQVGEEAPVTAYGLGGVLQPSQDPAEIAESQRQLEEFLEYYNQQVEEYNRRTGGR